MKTSSRIEKPSPNLSCNVCNSSVLLSENTFYNPDLQYCDYIFCHPGTFYLLSSGFQPCRRYTSSTYLLNHVSRCLKASTIQMSLISPRNFISSVIEKAMQGTAVILKMLLQQLCHENNFCNVSLTLQHTLDDLKSLPFQ